MLTKSLLQVEAVTSKGLIEEVEKTLSRLLDAKLIKLQPAASDDPFITRKDVTQFSR